MPRFRKKPIEILAEQYHDNDKVPPAGVLIFCDSRPLAAGQCASQGAPHIHTLEGPLHVSDGDWIATGINGEQYPIKPDIFEKSYDPVGPRATHTPGPWAVWSGPSYVGGGADLCIGAGETWLANMDHRNCINREQHICGGSIAPCKREGDTDICSTSGCRCDGECPEENHISDEQMANARLIASAPDLLDALKKALHILDELDYRPDDEAAEELAGIENVLAKAEGNG